MNLSGTLLDILRVRVNTGKSKKAVGLSPCAPLTAGPGAQAERLKQCVPMFIHHQHTAGSLHEGRVLRAGSTIAEPHAGILHIRLS